MNKLMVVAMATMSLLGGCTHSDSELAAAKDVSYALGQENGKKKGFQEGVQSVSQTVELIIATNKAKFEAQDKQREQALEKALACSKLPINFCPKSWMVDIDLYQKSGYSGVAGPQTFWILLTGWLIPFLFILLFLLGITMIYKLLKLEALAEEGKKLELIRQELKSENSKLDDRIANLTTEENQAMRQANRIRLNEEKMCEEAQIQRKAAEDEFEYFRSESAREMEEKEKELATIASEVEALKIQKNLFGG